MGASPIPKPNIILVIYGGKTSHEKHTFFFLFLSITSLIIFIPTLSFYMAKPMKIVTLHSTSTTIFPSKFASTSTTSSASKRASAKSSAPCSNDFSFWIGCSSCNWKSCYFVITINLLIHDSWDCRGPNSSSNENSDKSSDSSMVATTWSYYGGQLLKIFKTIILSPISSQYDFIWLTIPLTLISFHEKCFKITTKRL